MLIKYRFTSLAPGRSYEEIQGKEEETMEKSQFGDTNGEIYKRQTVKPKMMKGIEGQTVMLR